MYQSLPDSRVLGCGSDFLQVSFPKVLLREVVPDVSFTLLLLKEGCSLGVEPSSEEIETSGERWVAEGR